MTRDEFFNYLDIKDSSEFEYFEDFVNLVECGFDIDNDDICGLLEDMDMKVFRELSESYFNDIKESVPADQIDVYNLLENISRVLSGLSEAAGAGEEGALPMLAEELNRFRSWYTSDLTVECTNTSTGDTARKTLMDALTDSRLEKLGGDQYSYDFSETLKYELSEFMMSCADLAGRV